jgi:hypothetical protein
MGLEKGIAIGWRLSVGRSSIVCMGVLTGDSFDSGPKQVIRQRIPNVVITGPNNWFKIQRIPEHGLVKLRRKGVNDGPR